MDATSPSGTLPAPTPQRNHSLINFLPTCFSNSCKNSKKKVVGSCSSPISHNKSAFEIPFRAENPHIFDETFIEENKSLNSEVDSENSDLTEKMSLEEKCI